MYTCLYILHNYYMCLLGSNVGLFLLTEFRINTQVINNELLTRVPIKSESYFQILFLEMQSQNVKCKRKKWKKWAFDPNI